MSDNFDLKKFLKESKAIENLNPTFKSFNDVKSNETKKSLVENIKTKLNNIPLTEDKLRERIREMILAEMGNDSKEMDEAKAWLVDEEDGLPKVMRFATIEDAKDAQFDEMADEPYNRPLFTSLDDLKSYLDDQYMDDYDVEKYRDVNEGDLYEAKKDEEEIAIEDMPADEDIDLEAEPAAPEDELSAAASSATGDSKELINHLMTSLDTAKAMGNEKLTTQILNTLKFAIDQSMGGN